VQVVKKRNEIDEAPRQISPFAASELRAGPGVDIELVEAKIIAAHAIARVARFESDADLIRLGIGRSGDARLRQLRLRAFDQRREIARRNPGSAARKLGREDALQLDVERKQAPVSPTTMRKPAMASPANGVGRQRVDAT